MNWKDRLIEVCGEDNIEAVTKIVSQLLKDAKIEENEYWCRRIGRADNDINPTALLTEFANRISELKGER
jgi:hypothetical protein